MTAPALSDPMTLTPSSSHAGRPTYHEFPLSPAPVLVRRGYFHMTTSGPRVQIPSAAFLGVPAAGAGPMPSRRARPSFLLKDGMHLFAAAGYPSHSFRGNSMRAEKVRSLRYRDLPEDEKRIIDEEAAGCRTIPRKKAADIERRNDGVHQLVTDGAIPGTEPITAGAN